VARKKLHHNPRISDTIVFELVTPDNQQKVGQNPYSLDRLVIYHLESNRQGQKRQSYQKTFTSKHLLKKALEDDDGAAAAEAAAIKETIYFNEANPVYVIGEAKAPLWTEKNPGTQLKNTAPGKFEFEWTPTNQREGDYIIAWHYRFEPDGVSQSQNIHFVVACQESEKVLAPYRSIEPDKYKILLDRYLPAVYKTQILEDDLTPEVIEKLHFAVENGFTMLDNLTTQLVDITDANYTQQALLPLLASFFDLNLRSDDTNNWRRQIKRAVPLFKAKGTLPALKEALDSAGINLKKLTRLWQVVSPYTWVESFRVNKDHTFQLKKNPINDNMKVAVKSAGTKEYFELPNHFINLNKAKVIWAGAAQNEPMELLPGDIVRIQYQYRHFIAGQDLDNYILSLPLADQRNEEDQLYPLKNWNVRVIEEDDPMFSRIISDRHPFHDPVVFGKVRSTFMYSEKIYNMDTYDGSLRDSTNFCDIDRDFLDTCSSCLGSKFSVDLEITNLSTERVREAIEIIEEYSPFHASLHTMNIRGVLKDFVLSPIDSIESKIESKDGKPGFVDKIELKDRIRFKIQRKDGSQEEGEI